MVRHRNALLSPEDIKALEDVESACRKQRATFPNRHVEEAGLKPWMRQFAAWYALEGSALKKYHQLAKAVDFPEFDFVAPLVAAGERFVAFDVRGLVEVDVLLPAQLDVIQVLHFGEIGRAS